MIRHSGFVIRHPLHAILVAIGSHGDVHPYVGLARTLLARGHDVTLLASAHFQSLADKADVPFHPLGTDEDFREGLKDKTLWHPRKGFPTVMEFARRLALPTYDFIRDHDRPGQTVVAASSLAFGAFLARDKLGVPTATIHLAPSIFRSAVAPPRVPGLTWLRHAPPAFVDWFWNRAERHLIDPVITRWLDPMRRELGLPPVRSVIWTWINSPLTIGMFPDWYGPPAPDWPPKVKLTGFPLYDERDLPQPVTAKPRSDQSQDPDPSSLTSDPRPLTSLPAQSSVLNPRHSSSPLPDDLEHFLAAGPPPVAFTPGSAMIHGHRFFTTAVQACQRADLRALLLTRHPDQLPTTLPPQIKHVPYAPFSQLLPRCSAIAHHGGIGTTSQALAAACPQLVMPMAHDQPDNAHRLENLGVARTLYPRAFTPKKVARALEHLTADPVIKSACRAVAQHFRGADGLSETADLLESLVPAPTPA